MSSEKTLISLIFLYLTDALGSSLELLDLGNDFSFVMIKSPTVMRLLVYNDVV